MSTKLGLKFARIRQFKAIRDSGPVEFTPLTVLIGNNGSGKSSLVEAMEFVKTLAVWGLPDALEPWYGLEHIWHLGADHAVRQGDSSAVNPIQIEFSGHTGEKPFNAETRISVSASSGGPEIVKEHLMLSRVFIRRRDSAHRVTEAPAGGGSVKRLPPVQATESLLGRDEHLRFNDWTFLELNPRLMSGPKKRLPGRSAANLTKTGQNLAEYLLSFYEADKDAFSALLDILRLVLPFATELTPKVVTDLIETRIFIQLREAQSGKEFDLPSWTLSTGTLRILALLACLRHPTNPPKVLFVDEIENGLDPRTIGLLVDEIRAAVESGTTQVIATTHSPYLLDQLSLSQLILVERDRSGAPHFTRPDSDKGIKKWAKDFAPGKLYSMGRFSDRAKQ